MNSGFGRGFYKGYVNLVAFPFKKNKYGNRKTNVGGIVFDSAKEAARFRELKMLERSGLLSDMKIQQRFEIVPKAGGNKRARFYIADFTYLEGGKKIIEDVKSPITRSNAVYTLKKALVLWQYPEYEFRET